MIERFSKSLGFRADPNDPLRIVPSGGVSSWLILATAAIMAFLAAIAFAFAFSAARIADHWTADLARSATVRISVPADQIDAQTQRALEVLNTTPGIESASVVETSDQEALLAPWLGGVIALDEIDLPRLIAVVESPEGPDREGLRLRLAGEVPGARYDDHGQWRRPIVRTAGNVWRLSMVSIALVLLTTLTIVAIAAQASLMSHARSIATLRLMGAKDRFITRAFVRRVTVLALAGAALGTLCAVVVLLVQNSGGAQDLVARLAPSGVQWIWIIILPLAFAAASYVSAWATALYTLRRMS